MAVDWNLIKMVQALSHFGKFRWKAPEVLNVAADAGGHFSDKPE